MKVVVANKDRSGDLGKELTESARKRVNQVPPAGFSRHDSALALKETGTDTEYLNAFLNLLRIRCGLKTGPFDVPAKPGMAGKLIAWTRKLLWRILRYQHDRMAFQQHVINDLMTSAVEFEKASREKEISALKERVAELESMISGSNNRPKEQGQP